MVGGLAIGAATIGLIVMMATFRKNEAALAPIAFTVGSVLAAMDPIGALLALILAFSTMVVLRSFVAFFLTLAIALAAINYGFGKPLLLTLCGAGFASSPVLFAFFVRRGLVIAIRRSRGEQVGFS